MLSAVASVWISVATDDGLVGFSVMVGVVVAAFGIEDDISVINEDEYSGD